MTLKPDPHRGHRFPAEVIAHAVWSPRVFSPGLRGVELLLAERGVCGRFLRERRPEAGRAAASTASGTRATPLKA